MFILKDTFEKEIMRLGVLWSAIILEMYKNEKYKTHSEKKNVRNLTNVTSARLLRSTSTVMSY